MDPLGVQWLLSPSGSRAADTQTYTFFGDNPAPPGDITFDGDANFDSMGAVLPDSFDPALRDDEDEYVALSAANVYGTSELAPGQHMSTKVPPSWNGQGSWFAFEELVQDWQDICILDAEKQGPALRNRLAGDAAIYKPMLDRELLKVKETGVEYFLNTLRPQFVKGVQNVFLYRLMQFLNMRRGRLDLNRWIAKYNLQKKRLTDSWMDLLGTMTPTHPKWQEYLDIAKTEAITLCILDR